MCTKRQHFVGLAMLVCVTLIWGSGFIATEYALDSGMDPGFILLLRFAIAAATLGVAFFRKVRCAPAAHAVRGLCAGGVLFFAFYFQTRGQAVTTVSNAAFMTATNVMMIPLLTWLLTRRRPQKKVFFVCLLTMCGIAVLNMDASRGLQFNDGDWLVLIGAFLFAAHIVVIDAFCRDIDAASVTFWQMVGATLTAVVVLLICRPEWQWTQLERGAAPVLYLGLFSTCLCYGLQTKAQQYVPASQAGVALSMEGVFGTVFALALGLDVFRFNMMIGGLMITLSVILMEIGGKTE